MQETPLVSIIMPAYNSAEFIGEAIKSVLDQTYSNWELLVIDDVSVDVTVELVKIIARRESRLKLLQHSINKGTGAARNTGIKAATGTFIAFLDADDLWLPEKLEVQVKFMLEHDLAMSFAGYHLMAEDGTPLQKVVEALPVLNYEKLLKSNYVGNLTGIYNAKKMGKVLSPVVRKRQDWALWLSILKKVECTKAITRPLALYRIRKNSISNNKMDLLKYNFQIYRDFLGYGLLKSSRFMGIFLWEHFMVKSRQVKDIRQEK